MTVNWWCCGLLVLRRWCKFQKVSLYLHVRFSTATLSLSLSPSLPPSLHTHTHINIIHSSQNLWSCSTFDMSSQQTSSIRICFVAWIISLRLLDILRLCSSFIPLHSEAHWADESCEVITITESNPREVRDKPLQFHRWPKCYGEAGE